MLRPALIDIPGVAEVALLGGEREEVVVETTDAQLRVAGAAFSDVVTTLRSTLDHGPAAALTDLKRDPLLNKIARVKVAPMMAGVADADSGNTCGAQGGDRARAEEAAA